MGMGRGGLKYGCHEMTETKNSGLITGDWMLAHWEKLKGLLLALHKGLEETSITAWRCSIF